MDSLGGSSPSGSWHTGSTNPGTGGVRDGYKPNLGTIAQAEYAEELEAEAAAARKGRLARVALPSPSALGILTTLLAPKALYQLRWYNRASAWLSGSLRPPERASPPILLVKSHGARC